MNRVTAAIEKTKLRLEHRIQEGLTTPQKVQELHRELDMEPGEFCRFQELKSLAFAEGKLTLEEANTVYELLGETPDHFNKQHVAAKSVLTQIFGELLERRIS